MKTTAVEMLACPSCGGRLDAHPDESHLDITEVNEGTLRCDGCRREFPIVSGIPALAPPDDDQNHVARSFGFEWQTHHEGGFERDSVFGRTIDEDVDYFMEAFHVTASDLEGKTVLDAGCGSGALTVELARRFPKLTVVGMDINPAITEVYRQSLDLPNLHVVQGSVFEPPFPAHAFDLVWSNGVIHHTGSTRRAFDAVTDRVKPGGKAYLWVYEKKLSPMVGLRMALMPFGLTSWDHRRLYRLCQIISAPTWLAVRLLNVVGRSSAAQRRVHLRILTKRRGYSELVLTWFDVLSPRFRDTYTTAEFESWYRERGFTELTRYWWPVGVCGTRQQQGEDRTARRPA